MLFLGLDAGGSATRWVVCDHRRDIVSRGETNGFSGHIHDDAVRQRVESAIAAIAAQTAPLGAIASAHAGVTGLSAGAAEALWIGEQIAGAIGAKARDVFVEDDVSVAYRACFKPGEGLIVYAGTGSLALHLTRGGERWRAGGHGILIDDEGSAGWIAREALRRLLARDDAAPGAGWNTPLGRAFAERFGGGDWPHARLFVYSAHRGAIGELARAVAQAERDGDPIAMATLRDAGTALAALARTLLARTGALPVALVGGATRLSPTIADTFIAALGESVRARVLEIDATAAAAGLAIAAGLGAGLAVDAGLGASPAS